MFRVITLITITILSLTESFPDGAPADTCVKSRFNQPHHGQAKSQSLESLPYQVVASSDQYSSGQQIELTISGHDVFRGFFWQARDASTNEWIGEFLPSKNTKTIPECSSVTHADPKDKTQARLIWQAPHNKQGQVFFT